MNRLQSMFAAGLTTALSAAAIGAFATSQGVFGSESAAEPLPESITLAEGWTPPQLPEMLVAPAAATPQVIYKDLEPIVVTRQVFTTADPTVAPANSSPAAAETPPSATATATSPSPVATAAPADAPVFALAPEQPPAFASGFGSGFDDNGGDREDHDDDDWDDDDDDHDSDDDDDWDDDDEEDDHHEDEDEEDDDD